MKKSLIILGLLGLGGCAQFNELGEKVSSPPEDVLNAVKFALEWLGSLVGPFFVSIFSSLFG